VTERGKAISILVLVPPSEVVRPQPVDESRNAHLHINDVIQSPEVGRPWAIEVEARRIGGGRAIGEVPRMFSSIREAVIFLMRSIMIG